MYGIDGAKRRPAMPAFSEPLAGPYCAGAAGAGFVAGAGSAGFEASGEAGFMGCSLAGGLVLWVVVVSVPLPLSLQAATPSRASADTDARMIFFMVSLLQQTLTFR
ncbi:conserved hypothetical protein [Mesorhizobium plurifarium]|uniref:Uncharacterized protein n=1 Tax=Mesorhizobium plurifarium TaxID=69974 RepID=A0A0K2VQK1_MESPL|nr:conserved hypothetical protein [Mesorhizobium plurifarium]